MYRRRVGLALRRTATKSVGQLNVAQKVQRRSGGTLWYSSKQIQRSFSYNHVRDIKYAAESFLKKSLTCRRNQDHLVPPPS